LFAKKKDMPSSLRRKNQNPSEAEKRGRFFPRREKKKDESLYVRRSEEEALKDDAA